MCGTDYDYFCDSDCDEDDDLYYRWTSGLVDDDEIDSEDSEWLQKRYENDKWYNSKQDEEQTKEDKFHEYGRIPSHKDSYYYNGSIDLELELHYKQKALTKQIEQLEKDRAKIIYRAEIVKEFQKKYNVKLSTNMLKNSFVKSILEFYSETKFITKKQFDTFVKIISQKYEAKFE